MANQGSAALDGAAALALFNLPSRAQAVRTPSGERQRLRTRAAAGRACRAPAPQLYPHVHRGRGDRAGEQRRAGDRLPLLPSDSDPGYFSTV